MAITFSSYVSQFCQQHFSVGENQTKGSGKYLFIWFHF